MTLRSPGPATRRGEMLLLGVTAGSAGWEAVRSWVLDILSGRARRMAGAESAAQRRLGDINGSISSRKRTPRGAGLDRQRSGHRGRLKV